jgi:tight adherence protein B
VITTMAAGCVFAAVWVLSLPPPAALRLTAALRPTGALRPPGTLPRWMRAPGVAARVSHVRRALGGGRREVAARRAAVIELCDGIAAELAAGRPPGIALAHATDVQPGLPGLPHVMAAVRSGGDVAAALGRASRKPGCEGLRLLAGCWRIGVDRGGTLAAVIEGLADALRDEQSHREDVALQLAGPRATARLLAGLPLLGLAMAVALGARPLAFLFGTVPGCLCLALGSGLDVLGLWWTRRLAATAEDVQ